MKGEGMATLGMTTPQWGTITEFRIPTMYFTTFEEDLTPVVTAFVGNLLPKNIDGALLVDMCNSLSYALFAESEDKRIGRFVEYWRQNKGSYVFGTDFIFLFKDEFSFYK